MNQFIAVMALMAGLFHGHANAASATGSATAEVLPAIALTEMASDKSVSIQGQPNSTFTILLADDFSTETSEGTLSSSGSRPVPVSESIRTITLIH